MSEDLKILKKRIFDLGHVQDILCELGCHHIKTEQRGNLIVAGLPEGDNNRSVQVKNNQELYASIRSKGIEGDIFSIIGFVLYECINFEDVRKKLYQIKTWICNALSYDDIINTRYEKQIQKVDWNSWLRPIQQSRFKDIEITDNNIINESALNQFIRYPWAGWIEEGLLWEVQKEFDICYDLQSDRVVIPIHNKEGNLIGAKGRYVGNDERIINEHGQKYLYIYPCSKSIELFNLHRALPFIEESKECIVVEGAKTVMFLWQWGYKNTVSIEGDRLSPVQAKLLKDLGLDVNLLFAWDKDKDVDFIRRQIRQIKNRRMFVLWDAKNLFKGKESPCDKGLEEFQKLYESHRMYRVN